MNLQDLRRKALGRYGNIEGYLGDEDSRFPLPLLSDVLNQSHRRIAELIRCYRESQSYDVPLVSNGLCTVLLNCNVIEVIDGTVRFNSDGTWLNLNPQAEQAERSFGPFEGRSDSTPFYYYLRVGAAVGGQRVLEIYPGGAAVTDGLKLDAYIYPGNMTATTDAPSLQVAEHPVLLTACCQALAEIEGNVGKWQLWSAKLDAEIEDLRRIMGDFKSPGTRRILYSE